MEFTFFTLLYGVSYGLLLFMLASGLTLIFSMMGVLSFAHGSFYMLGEYFAYVVTTYLGFWYALVLAPLAVGMIGAAVERYGLRSVHKYGHVHEILFTFGLSYLLVQMVVLIWGGRGRVYRFPDELQGPLFTAYTTTFPIYRGFIMLVALLMMAALYLLLTRTRLGLVIQASLTHPATVEALGHNVPRANMLVFGGGCALAGLAGVVGGAALSTSAAMGAAIGSILFVVIIVGGMGSLTGALVASLLIGVLQTFGVALDHSLSTLLSQIGIAVTDRTPGYPLLTMTISQVAPILPYLLMIVILIFRPRGLMGTREG